MNRTRLNRVSKSDRRQLELQADRLWSDIVLAEGAGKCLYCGKRPRKGACHPAHIVPRRFKHLRHDVRNGISVCFTCHRLIDNEGQQEFRNWLSQNYPEKASMLAVRWLDAKAGPVTCSMLRDIITRLAGC